MSTDATTAYVGANEGQASAGAASADDNEALHPPETVAAAWQASAKLPLSDHQEATPQNLSNGYHIPPAKTTKTTQHTQPGDPAELDAAAAASARSRSAGVSSSAQANKRLTASVSQAKGPDAAALTDRLNYTGTLKDAVRVVMRINKMKRITSLWRVLPERNLCEICKSLDLNIENFILPERSSEILRNPATKPLPPSKLPFQKAKLGTLKQIFLRSIECPLCRLIIKSLSEQPDPKLHEVVGGKSTGETFDDIDADCEISWNIDGKEKVRDKYDNPTGLPRNKTRRLCLKWSKRGLSLARLKDSYLVLVAPPEFRAHKQLFLGRPLAQEALDTGNAELVRDWYHACYRYHKECKIPHDDHFENLRKESYFGVVDLEEMRLTALPPKEEYVALSYTWGSSNDRFRTTLSNVQDLQEPDGIRKIYDQLPRAIQDSIALAKTMEHRYLWVDSLCILQDDDEVWRLNAGVMDLVYGNASLTICAADGNGAHVGLSALWPVAKELGRPSALDATTRERTRTSRPTQHIMEYKKGLQLMVSFPSEFYVGKTMWNSRAWTFQERLLSRRCLIFAEDRVYFQCPTTTMCEDIHTERAHLGWFLELENAPTQRLKEVREDPVNVYHLVVKMFTDRQLTKEGDIMAAFNGMAKMLCARLGGTPIYGLPTSHFDLALLWEPEDAPDRRYGMGSPRGDGDEAIKRKKERTVSAGASHNAVNGDHEGQSHSGAPQPHSEVKSQASKPELAKLKFPSWSWCGWKGWHMEYRDEKVHHPMVNLHEWLRDHTWISWYIRDGRGNLRPVWGAASTLREQCEAATRWHGYSFNARQEAENGPNTTTTGVTRTNSGQFYDSYGRRFDADMAGLNRDNFKKTLPKYPYQVRVVQQEEATLRADESLDDQRFLQFWTWSAFFFLVDDDDQVGFTARDRDPGIGRRQKRFLIQDANTDTVGTIVLPVEWAASLGTNLDVPQEFIAISDATRHKEELPHTYYIDQKHGQSGWAAYNVLLLGYDEDPVRKRIARRVGLGKVWKQAFDNPCERGDWKSEHLASDHPVKLWKEIILG